MTWEACFQTLAPEWVLLAGGCASLFAGVTRLASRPSALSGLALAALLIALVLSIVLYGTAPETAVPGLWITPLTHFVRVVVLGVGALILLVNWSQPAREEHGEYMGLILFSLLGVLLAASANDLLVLFFAIELVSVPTYILVALSRPSLKAAEAAVKYFFLGAMAAALLAFGLSFLYGATGTTTLYAVHEGARVSNFSAVGTTGAIGLIGLVLAFAGLAFKVSAVPLHAYVADVYEGAASPITGMLGFVPKMAGFIVLVRLFSAFDWNLSDNVFWLVWLVSAASMTVGNVLALLQDNVKRMLAYSGIAHSGYMLIGLLVGPAAGEGPLRDGVAALFFYMAVYGAMNLGAFAMLASFRIGGREAETLDDLAGIARRFPLASMGLCICVFSLMGFPLTAGFLGKIYLFSSAFSLPAEHSFQGPMVLLAVIAVLNSAIGAAYYLRIAATVVMGRAAEPVEQAGTQYVRWSLAVCSLAMVALFLWPGQLVVPARAATIHVASIRGMDADRVTSTAAIRTPRPGEQ